MKGSDRKTRRLPLVVFALGLLLMVTTLPSVLNITQPNPSQTLEYAPVSPDDSNAPPGGNLSALGLGSTNSLRRAASETDEELDGAPGRGARPSTKRCVGRPPRQSEDPLSPPCVAFFDGDNGGATTTGVTRTEVRVLAYMSGGQTTLCEEFVDLAGSVPNEQAARTLAAYQRYFNDRFQTYGRFVHMFLQRGKCGNSSAEARRADAELGYQRIRPFAAISFAVFGNQEAYLEAMANRGVVTFLSRQASNFSNDFFSRFSGRIWGYNPTIEQFAEMYASYVCSRVVPFRVSFSGNPFDENVPRKLGHLYPADPAYPELERISKRVAELIDECGGDIALTRTFYPAMTPATSAGPNDSQQAAGNIAAFRQNNITTILWTGGNDSSHSRSAGAIGYRPEWVLLGTSLHDRPGHFQDQSVWQHAWVVTISTLVENHKRQRCYVEAKEADPEISDFWASSGCFLFYPSVRQAFTGIQVAGPRLTARAMDEGFHAIPHVASTDATSPACFYGTADYSCVKDAMAEWWDPNRTSDVGAGVSTAGCWAAPERGRRFLSGAWPKEDVPSRRTINDPCNNSL